ncbi:MAG: cupin domain-containing protein [Puniceicoccaceae bacterium]
MVVPPASTPEEIAQGVRGGQGLVYSRRLLGPHPGSAIQNVGLVRLPPGSSIGLHGHQGDEDAYFCLSGQGIVTDNGVEHSFTPGTLQITRHSETQALRNVGPDDLVFLGILAQTHS